jgi:hypothetical protein
MAAAQLIAVGTGALDSAEFDVTSSMTIGLMDGFTNEARAQIKLKDSANNFITVFELSSENSVIVVTAPGTFKVTRLARPGGSCGVFRGA